MQHLILKIRAQSDLVSFDQQFFPFVDIFLLTSNDIVLKKKEKNYIHEIKSTLLVSERKKKIHFCANTLTRIRQSFKLLYSNKNI